MALEMLRSVITLAQGALRAAMLINGGAAVAILGSLSSAWTKGVPPAILSQLRLSLLFFASGVLAAAAASGFAYLSQKAFASEQQCYGKIIRAVIILLMILSYALFGLGSWGAYSAFGAIRG
jgi:hypothetical protein